MSKNLVDSSTGKLLTQLTDSQVQAMQDLVDQGELFGRGLQTAQTILQSTNEDIQVTKSEYADVLSILQQTLNVGQNIGTTIGEAISQLQSISTILNRSVGTLVRGDTILKSVLRSTYQLQGVADRIQSIRIEGDLWKIKDLTRANQEITRIQQSLLRHGQRFGYSAGELVDPVVRSNIGTEARRASYLTDATVKGLKDALSTTGVFTFRGGQGAGRNLSDAPGLKRILDWAGGRFNRAGDYTLDLNPLSNRNKGDLLRKLKEYGIELREIQTIVQDLTESEKLRKENLNEFKITQDTISAVGSRNSQATVLSKLAGKVGLGDLADLIQTADFEATRAAKIHLTLGGDESGAQKVYDEVFGIVDLGEKLKESVVETYLNLGKWGGPLGAALALTLALYRQLLKFDEQAVATKRVIGQWADASAVANFSFVSGTEVLKTMVQLGQQFKINPVQVFSTQELANIARAQKFTGMTAEAAGNLAVQSRISGQNANTYRDAIAKGASQANVLNHSAVSLSAVQNDVLQTSRAIALSYGNHTAELSRAAGAAASLGMNLQQVEDISKNLMNFESSIQAEMQAQLLTGMQLNLAKAREYALNNNLEGVTREISRQGMNAAKFSHMNYIQQENMAKALGMSREQLSKMLIMQELNSGLSAKQVAAMTNMRKEDIEALSAQEKWQTMKQKFLESLMPLLEPILQVTSDILRLLTPIVGAIGWLAKQISTFGGLIKEDNLLLRAIPTILAVALVAGLKFAGVFATIGKLTTKIGTGILSWIPGLGKARVAAQATDVVFDKTANRWRNVTTGRFVKAPLAQQATQVTQTTVQGPSRMSRLFSSLGRNMTNILKGAAAAAIMAGAVWVLAKAAQEFSKVSWGDVGKAVIGLLALTAAVTALGLLMSSVVGGAALLAGAAAMVVVAGSVFILGKAVQQLTAVPGDELQSIASGIRSIAGAVAELAGKLDGLSVRKLNALEKAFKRLRGAQVQVSTFENTGESQEIRRDSLAATAQTITIQQAQVQAAAQQISVEQKATDLSEIRADIQAVKNAVLQSRPNWNWLEFNHQAALHGFVTQ